MADFTLAGYDVVELLGFGSGGEVWLAREHATGDPVALKRVRDGADIATLDRLRREAAVLAGVEHPHVLRLRSVVGSADAVVLVLELATGGSLARLLATRRRLEPGEVVTIVVPVAQALASAHARGVAHGDVTPANVLFTADGKPVLSDLGVSRLLGTPGQPAGTRGFLDPAVLAGDDSGPAGDVHGLAATCFAALTGHPPYDDLGARRPAAAGRGPLLDVLERALAADPAQRPGAAELAALAYEAAVARPVRLDAGASVTGDEAPWAGAPGAGGCDQPMTHVASAPVGPGRERPPAPGGTRRRGRAAAAVARVRRRVSARWRVAAGGLFAAVALGMAAVTGLAWAAGDDPVAASGAVSSGEARSPGVSHRAPAAPTGPDWGATLAALDERRSQAFAAADPRRLAEVYAPEAPALRRDSALMARLVAAGLRAEGLQLRAVAVTELAQRPRRVTLQVEDVMPPYRLVDGSGAVVAERPGRPRVRWTVTLVQVGRSWQVYDVLRV